MESAQTFHNINLHLHYTASMHKNGLRVPSIVPAKLPGCMMQSLALCLEAWLNWKLVMMCDDVGIQQKTPYHTTSEGVHRVAQTP